METRDWLALVLGILVIAVLTAPARRLSIRWRYGDQPPSRCALVGNFVGGMIGAAVADRITKFLAARKRKKSN
jgi:hypothetical protein